VMQGGKTIKPVLEKVSNKHLKANASPNISAEAFAFCIKK
jgi:hypothetical protein